MSDTNKRNLRNYGLGETEVSGSPRIKGQLDKPCPHCGCPAVYEIEVDVASAGGFPLSEGEWVGKYLGCAACPWASPCISTKVASQVSK